MLAGLISTAARGIKGGAEAYGMAAKSKFDKNEKVDLSQQLLDMEEQMKLRVDDYRRQQELAQIPKTAQAEADAASITAVGDVNAEAASLDASSSVGLPGKKANQTAAQLKANKANVTELANQTGAAAATELNATVNSPGYLDSRAKDAAANESPSAQAQRALAEFELTNKRVVQNARSLLAQTTDPKERDALGRTISDLTGASIKSAGDVASLARSWLKIADAQSERAKFASQEDADALNAEAAFAEQQAASLLNSIAGDSGKSFPVPPPAAIDRLKSNPSLKSAFDAKYGKGASAKHLGGK
jgi:hypothetical protein